MPTDPDADLIARLRALARQHKNPDVVTEMQAAERLEELRRILAMQTCDCGPYREINLSEHAEWCLYQELLKPGDKVGHQPTEPTDA